MVMVTSFDGQNPEMLQRLIDRGPERRFWFVCNVKSPANCCALYSSL